MVCIVFYSWYLLIEITKFYCELFGHNNHAVKSDIVETLGWTNMDFFGHNSVMMLCH